MNLHIDLSIIDGDFDFSPNLTEKKLSGVDVIAQDVKHRILESGLLIKLIKLRNDNAVAPVLTELELEVEKDDRLKPGTIFITKNDDHTLTIEADTKESGQYHE